MKTLAEETKKELTGALVKLFIMAHQCDSVDKEEFYGGTILKICDSDDEGYLCIHVELIETYKKVKNIAQIGFDGETLLLAGTAESIIEFSDTFLAW